MKKSKEDNKLLPRIETFKGIFFNILKPKTDDIDIEDIAHALANQCRYGGHCLKFISVAEHCVLVSKLLEMQNEHNMMLWPLYLAGLLHDASEAYLVDIPTPVKRQLKDYKRIETVIMEAIFKKFELPYTYSRMPEDIHYFDTLALRIEALKLIRSTGKDWQVFNDFDDSGTDISQFKVKCLRPTQAKRFFMIRFYELMGDSNNVWRWQIPYWIGKVLPI